MISILNVYIQNLQRVTKKAQGEIVEVSNKRLDKIEVQYNLPYMKKKDRLTLTINYKIQ